MEHKVQRHCTAVELVRAFFIPGSLRVHSIYKKNTCTSIILNVFCQSYNIRILPPPNMKQAMCRNQSSRNDWKYSFSTHKSPRILFSYSIPQRHYQPPCMLPRNRRSRTAGSCSLLNGLTYRYCIRLGQAVFESIDFSLFSPGDTHSNRGWTNHKLQFQAASFLGETFNIKSALLHMHTLQ